MHEIPIGRRAGGAVESASADPARSSITIGVIHGRAARPCAHRVCPRCDGDHRHAQLGHVEHQLARSSVDARAASRRSASDAAAGRATRAAPPARDARPRTRDRLPRTVAAPDSTPSAAARGQPFVDQVLVGLAAAERATGFRAPVLPSRDRTNTRLAAGQLIGRRRRDVERPVEHPPRPRVPDRDDIAAGPIDLGHERLDDRARPPRPSCASANASKRAHDARAKGRARRRISVNRRWRRRLDMDDRVRDLRDIAPSADP